MSTFSWPLFESLPVVGILRGFPREVMEKLVPAVLRGGLTTIEVTMNSPDAAGQIATIAELGGGDLNVGAGTVTSLADLETALGAGASFIVTPIVVPEVIRACREKGVPVFPGALTPTEIFQAWQAGADMVKLFPASRLGPGYLKDVKAPLNQVRLMAVGGITVELVPEYRAAGAEGVGVGSPLFHPKRIAAGDWAWVTEQTSRFRAVWAETR